MAEKQKIVIVFSEKQNKKQCLIYKSSCSFPWDASKGKKEHLEERGSTRESAY